MKNVCECRASGQVNVYGDCGACRVKSKQMEEDGSMKFMEVPCDALAELDPNGKVLTGVMTWVAEKCSRSANGDRAATEICVNRFVDAHLGGPVGVTTSSPSPAPTEF